MQALSEWGVAAAIREGALLYPLVNAAHILGIALLIGTIATLDLRLLGLFRQQPLAALAPPLWRVAAGGLSLALLTGFLLFSTRPADYLANPALLTKLALVTVGIANALLLHRSAAWHEALSGTPPRPRLKFAAGLSLACWLGALLAGRWIGFLQ
ncbi:DUF2214 domain-containing protein [Pseudoroseomonas globiformis]|uniref:DUF2214 domain-containing protein n=1 Tax=Teichococcus globiformis TaxID=2307229 RepID=A0ABV7G5V7_9PROT